MTQQWWWLPTLHFSILRTTIRRHMSTRLRLLSLSAAACFFTHSAETLAAGGRPLTTDDAALTTSHSCQIESYFQHTTRDGQLWVLPACNPTGKFEFTAGALFDQPADTGNAIQYTLQGKFLLPGLPNDRNGFETSGMSFGAFYVDPYHHGGSRFASAFAYIPVTLQWTEATQTHFNLGWNHDALARRDDLTYAAAVSHDITHRLGVFAEVFGTGSVTPTIQIGASQQFVKNTIQLDGSFGRPVDAAWRDAVFSVGLEWYPAALW